MAKTTVVTLTDDLDGTRADRTVSFGWSGTTYEIDLSKKNATALEKSLAPYLDVARKAHGSSARGSSTRGRRTSASAKPDLSAVRAWAKDNGHTVSDRGRIAASVIEAYNASK
jgi:Lsr2